MARKPTPTIDDLIDAAGLSFGDVATRADIDPRSLWKIRKGLVERPRSTTVARLAKVLGVTPEKIRAAAAASRAQAGTS